MIKDGPIITFKFYLSCNLIVSLVNLIAPWVATQLRHFQTIAASSLVLVRVSFLNNILQYMRLNNENVYFTCVFISLW